MALGFLSLLLIFSAIAIIVLFWSAAITHARDNGQYAQADPKIRQWFQNQRSPKNGVNCCSEADGDMGEEDIRDGHYWYRSAKTEGQWMPVPDEVILHTPNITGHPVAWFLYKDGKPIFRCYSPGALF